jgi:hypothetical protein
MTGIKEKGAYRSDIFLVKLGPDDGGFEKILDLSLSRKASQRRREGSFDMTVSVPGHLNLQPGDIQISEHAILRVARIVKRKLRHQH